MTGSTRDGFRLWLGSWGFLASLLVVLSSPALFSATEPLPATDLEAGLRAYHDGRYAAAARSLLPLAKQGDQEAQFAVGVMYSQGRGFELDQAEAAAWFLEAAKQGDPRAAYSLGLLYHRGQGVPSDPRAALRWIRRAGIHGSAETQYALGVIYAKGQGVPQDLVEASRWYFKAAHQGHSKAQYNLGLMYAKGRAIPQDDKAAAHWFRKAAEQGDPRAQYNLGVLFVNGRGVERDYAQAYVWLSQAALSDDPETRRPTASAATRQATIDRPARVAITGDGPRDGVGPVGRGVAQGSATFRDLRCCLRQEKPRVWQTTSPALRTGIARPYNPRRPAVAIMPTTSGIGWERPGSGHRSRPLSQFKAISRSIVTHLTSTAAS